MGQAPAKSVMGVMAGGVVYAIPKMSVVIYEQPLNVLNGFLSSSPKVNTFKKLSIFTT